MAGLGTLQELRKAPHLPPQGTNPAMEDTAGRDLGPCPPTWSLSPGLALWGRSPMGQSSRNTVPVCVKKPHLKGWQRDKHQLFPARHRGHPCQPVCDTALLGTGLEMAGLALLPCFGGLGKLGKGMVCGAEPGGLAPHACPAVGTIQGQHSQPGTASGVGREAQACRQW